MVENAAALSTFVTKLTTKAPYHASLWPIWHGEMTKGRGKAENRGQSASFNNMALRTALIMH
jgi:hypothetical protein